MYKTLLRTLSALSIVTITASAGFADQHGAQPRSVNCADLADKYHPTCRANIPPVTTGVWAGSFVDPKLSDSPDLVDRKDQFLAPSFAMEVYEDYERVNLKLDTDGNGKKDTIIGTSIFYITKTNGTFNYYAGILSGADLGAPITEAFPEAVWKGRFKAILVSNTGKDLYVNRLFDLRVSFTGAREGTETTAGEISARIPHVGRYSFQINGQFNAKGVITGTNGITYGHFANAQAEPTGTIVGTLTGIIGEKGALGAFHSDGAVSSDRIRGFTGGFRANGFSEDDLEVLRACSLDPFDSLCNEDRFNDLKDARVDLCTQGDKAGAASLRANPTECDNAVGVHDCLVNPFKTTCAAEDSDFKKYLDIAQANRAVYCGKRGNVAKPLCKRDSIVEDVCGVNPFGEVCGSSYYSTQVKLMKNCNDDNMDNNAGCPAIADIIRDCENKPFGANCGFDAFKAARKALITTCHDMDDMDECADGVLKQPNAATWVNTLTTRAENPIVLGDGADVISAGDQFLKNIKKAQTNEEIDIYNNPDPPYAGTIYSSLNLSTAEFNISGTPNGKATPLDGHAEDGVASFYGKPKDQSSNYSYAGIFSTTDLGAPLITPLENEPKTASWVGSFSHYDGNYYDGSSYSFVQDFVLEVNFDTQSIEAFIVDANEGFSHENDYYLTGNYDDNGVISGRVVADRFTDNNRYKPSRNRSSSPLTGLIGKEGAVGAFVGYNYAGGFVARPADLVELVVDENTTKTAETFLNETCAEDPFHEFCYLSKKRKARIELCSMGDNALNALVGDTNCVTAAESDPCIRYPFDEGCKTTATSPYQTVRENRSAFCNKSANKDNTLCTGGQRVALCSYKPFNAICSDTLYDNARKAVCKAGFDHEDCDTDDYTTTSNDVTAISWLADFYKDNGFVPQTESDTLRPRRQFLQGTEDGLDNGYVAIRTYDSEVDYYDLNLNTATFDGLELGKDKNDKDREDAADDGVAFFRGVNNRYYAGIFSGTDLGAPLDRPTEEADMTAKWYGQFQAGSFKTDFTLNIDFSKGGTDGSEGTVEAFVHISGIQYYLLQGYFDENGVINGNIISGSFPNHDYPSNLYIYSASGLSRLTGLIGAEGAVGVFSGGGFVASPSATLDSNVKFSDWVRSFDNESRPRNYIPYDDSRQARFVQGTETGLNSDGFWHVRNSTRLTLADVNAGGKVADGVAYVSGVYSFGDQIPRHYAGVLSGTHLGEPLDATVVATWKGRLGLVANNIEVALRDIDLTVDFTNKKLKFAEPSTDNTHIVSFVRDGISWDNHGVLSGIINYRATSNGEDIKGKVSGLIGKDGAVAAFKSDEGSATPYAGGFVAVPSTVFSQIVKFSDWVKSFDNTHPLLISVPYNDPRQTRFVQGTETGLNTDWLNLPWRASFLRPSPLTLADINTDGESADGVAYMFGTRGYSGHNTHHVAGILSGTYLGAVLDAPVTATWSGKLGMIVDEVEVPLRDITLNINFTNTVRNITIADTKTTANTHFVNFNNLSWDENGVITGKMTYNPGDALNPATNITGTVTGLIGEEGAVGAFRSDGRVTTPYAGGFVAVPSAVFSHIVNFLGWVSSFGNTPRLPDSVLRNETQQARFLQGTRTSLVTDNLMRVVQPASPLTLADVNTDGQSADGVAYMAGTQGLEWNPQTRLYEYKRYHYAGILSGTNLGGVLKIRPADANGDDAILHWQGKLGMIVNGATPVESSITLDVNYTDQNITLNRTAIGLGAVSFTNVGWDNTSGVLTGAITYDPNDSALADSAGTVRGLIGKQGAVGAFISNHGATSSFAGGFVARPPAEPASP